MITLNNFTKLDNNQYQMVLSMKKTDSVEDLPSESRPMSPEYFAVTVDYGTPAYGSVVIKEDGEVLTYSAGVWEKAEAAGEAKLKKLFVEENGEYLPEGEYVGFNEVNVDVKSQNPPIKPQEPPVKGDVIMLDGKQYRVLEINNNIAELYGLYTITSQEPNMNYFGSKTDTYLNETFYSELPKSIQDAIVEKYIIEDSFRVYFSENECDYYYKNNSGVQYLKQQDSYVNSSEQRGFRKCYLISLSTILKYCNATKDMTAQDTSFTEEVMDQLTPLDDSEAIVFITEADSADYHAEVVLQYSTTTKDFSAYYTDSGSVPACPAFQIDLSKVDWTKAEY